MTFSQDILAAADTIDKLNAHMQFGDRSHWNAHELRNTAKAIEQEEREEGEREEWVARLAMDLFNQWYPRERNDKTYTWQAMGTRYRQIACALIESGWRPTE